MKNIKEYLSAEDIKYALANTPQIVFEITDACNLSCEYCVYGQFYSDYGNRKNNMLSVNNAFQLIEYMNMLWSSPYNRSYNNDVYIGFYGGEPLLNMSFIGKVIDYIKKTNCSTRRFKYSMTTNAILLHKHMDYLAKNKFNLLISLDGDELYFDYTTHGIISISNA